MNKKMLPSPRDCRPSSAKKAEMFTTNLGLILSRKLDFDVFLTSKGINLQRSLVWTNAQKEQPIPPIAINLRFDETLKLDVEEKYYYDVLPKEWLQIHRYSIGIMECQDLTDEEKIEWFQWINVARTPIDNAHLELIKSLGEKQ